MFTVLRGANHGQGKETQKRTQGLERNAEGARSVPEAKNQTALEEIEMKKIREWFFILVLAAICAVALSGYLFFALVGLAVYAGG